MAGYRTQVFISYSHRDSEWLDRLKVHLKPLVRESTIEVWEDTGVAMGVDWAADVRAAVQRANIAILLVSADFLASDFIVSQELPLLLESAERDGAIVIPIIVGPCGFIRTQGLSRFQAANPPSRPLLAGCGKIIF